MSLSILLTSLLGGWVAADATAVGQLLIGQPLVGGLLTGLIWGEPLIGLQVGALLQLFALGRLPLGGRTPDDFAAAGVVGPAVSILLDRLILYPYPTSILLVGIISGLGVAIAGRPLIRWMRSRNELLARWAENRVIEGDAGALDRSHWLGVAHAFALGVAVTGVGIAVATTLGRWALGFDAIAVGQAAATSEPLLWGLGAGLAVRQFVHFRHASGTVFIAVLALLLALRMAVLP